MGIYSFVNKRKGAGGKVFGKYQFYFEVAFDDYLKFSFAGEILVLLDPSERIMFDRLSLKGGCVGTLFKGQQVVLRLGDPGRPKDRYLQGILSDKLLLRLALAVLGPWVRNYSCLLGSQEAGLPRVPALAGAWRPWGPGRGAVLRRLGQGKVLRWCL